MSNDVLVGWKNIAAFTKMGRDQLELLARERGFPITLNREEGPVTTKSAVIEWVESRIKRNAARHSD